MGLFRRSRRVSSPFVTQAELRDRLNEDATVLSGALLLTAQQFGFLNWLERQVDALQVYRVDADTLQAIIQRWQTLRVAAAARSDDGITDLIAVDS